MHLFVSTDDATDDLTHALVARLRREAWTVDLSPAPETDSRWPSWYDHGCTEALAHVDAVVAVVTPAWSSSTWLAHEADTALRGGRPLFLWNPMHRDVSAGMVAYTGRMLPDALGAAVAVLSCVRAPFLSDLDDRPLATPAYEAYARELFPLTMSPEEYVARYADRWMCFSFDDYRYSDPVLDRWIQRLGDILFRRGAVPDRAELRARYLTTPEP